MENNTLYTSDPWHQDYGDEFIFEILDARNGIISDVIYDISIDQTKTEMLANACLITVAPELCEACKYLLGTEEK